MVVGDLGVEHRPHGEGGVGVGVVLHHVDAPGAGLARPVVVDGDLARGGIDLQRADHVDAAPVGQIEHGRGPVDGGLQGGDVGPHRGLGPVDDLVGQGLDVVQPVGVAQGGQPLGPHLARGHLGVQVAGHVVGLADVGQDEAPDVGVALARPHQLADGDPQALLEAVPAAGPDAVAADVGVVDGGPEQGDQPGPAAGRGAPGWHQHGHVEELPGRLVGVVGDEHVAGLELIHRELLEHFGRADGQAVDVAGGAGHGLGHHAAPAVEHGVGQVAGFSHDGAEGGALQGPGLLADRGDQRLPQDLQLDGVEPAVGHTGAPP